MQAIQTGFLKQIEQLQVPHAAVVPALVLQPGAVTEQDGDALLLPASTSVTAAVQVPPSPQPMDLTAAAQVPPAALVAELNTPRILCGFSYFSSALQTLVTCSQSKAHCGRKNHIKWHAEKELTVVPQPFAPMESDALLMSSVENP